MMDRRVFIVGGVVAAVAAPLAAEAQQAGKVYRIELIGLDPAEVPGHTAFRQGLRSQLNW